ncbi:glycine-rich protein [Cohnella boryungensis]
MRRSLAYALCVVFMLMAVAPPFATEVKGAVLGTGSPIPTGGVTGENGGVNLTPAFRVGLAKETLNTNNKLDEEMTSNEIEDKLRAHFNNHFPKMEHSIIFSPTPNYSTNSQISWYSASDGNLIPVEYEAAYYSRKLRHLGTDKRGTPLFFDRLNQYAPYSKTENKIEKALGKGKWKNVVDWSSGCNSNCANKAASVWNWILGDSNRIDEQIKDYTFDSLNDKEPNLKHEARLHYLDLLITLWILMPGNDEKDYVAGEIDRFIAMRELDTKPVLIAIDTVSRFYAPKHSTKYLYIPSIDFVLWAHGATPSADLRLASFAAGSSAGKTKEMIAASATKAIAEQPNRKRTTSLSPKGDAFKYGYNGVVGWTFNTYNNKPSWGSRGSVDKGIMEVLQFSGGTYYGFMIAGGTFNKPDGEIKCTCAQQLSLPNKADVEGKLEGKVVGKYVDVQISMKETDSVKLADWKNLLKGAANLRMKVELTRSEAPGEPIWITQKGPKPAVGNISADYQTITQDQILRYLSGKDDLLYNDDLTSYEIPEDTTVEFKYKTSVSIRGISPSGEEFTIVCTEGKPLSLRITGPSIPVKIKQIGTYSSSPEFWSELKQGRPGAEEFEAMAGTPTTRHLYFATGGSEFIVDVVVEYVPEATSTRTYRSYYSGGVPSEFKIGDQAKDYTVPSPSGASSSSLTVNGHQGGTVTATWTGVTPYTGSVTWSDHSVNVNNKWDDGPYKAAKAQAEAWASAVNGFTIKHTAASDGITRPFNSWGASITSDSNTHPAGWANPGQPQVMGSCGDPPSPCVTQPYVASSGQNGQNGAFSITVTGKLPARIIDGPSSIYDLPSVQDTWKQTVTYDYTKITKAKVWKIDRSKINGMAILTDDEENDELTATIKQGDPTIFMNIADETRLENEASRQNRLRYSLEPDQHDTVTWYEGPRTNKDNGLGNNGWISGPGQSASWATGTTYTNSSYSDTENAHTANSTAKDKLTTEYVKFNERRKTLMEVTAVSDFLILQTSSGDQAVMYFDKTSPKIQAQQKAEIPKTSFEEQWTNNPLSAAKWDKHHINIGSYNGNYAAPAAKYSSYGSGKAGTIFDPGKLPAGKNRTARPTAPLRLVLDNIDVVDTKPNGQYVTGTSDVFYKLIVNERDKNEPTTFDIGYDERYGDNGAVFGTTYSNQHGKVNDIVIHNPVSTEDAIIIPLEAWRDQRTSASKLVGGNLQQPTIDYEKRLKPDYVFTPTLPVYEEQTVANPNYVPARAAVSSDFVFTGAMQTFKSPSSRSYTIEAWGAEGGGVTTGMEYEWYNEAHDVYIWYPGNVGYRDTYCENHPSVLTGRTRGGSATSGGLGGYAKGMVSLQANEQLYVHVGGQGSGGNNGTAAGGWNGGGAGSYYSGGGGGASDVRRGGIGLPNRILAAGGGGGAQIVPNQPYFAQGGAGGGNHGGNGATHGFWSTDYTSNGGSQTAGGIAAGGIQYQWYNEAHQVYLWYDSATGYEDVYCGPHHPSRFTGVTSSASSHGNSGTLGAGGSASTTSQGGGGGGYYGGASGAYQGYSGAGGSGYIGGVEDGVMNTGVRSDNGAVRISGPALPAIGSPTMTVKKMVSAGMSEPPDEAYEYVPVVNHPGSSVTTPNGPTIPGEFINLDDEFTVFFPNVGDFYGNGAYGIPSTSAITGKGFTDNMATTEWTKSKQVKFNFYATYNGRTYAPGEWIELDVQKEKFEFYLPLANREALSALVEFRAIAINASYPDHDSVRNKVRFDNLAARHSAIKSWNIDLVGRIGALVLEDTGDFRFSNLFKQELFPTEWLVPNVVKKVNANRQNNIVADTVDVRGEPLSAAKNYLDTYGLLPHLRKSPIALPLSPDKNNVVALRNQPMRLGYNVLADIQTIGNYYDHLQIIPYYYCLDLGNSSDHSVSLQITPVDIYMSVNGAWKPINLFNAVSPGWNSSVVYPYNYSLDWNAEAGRRNYTEAANTNAVVEDQTYVDDGTTYGIGKPYGSYHPFGTAQLLNGIDERNRTFIGTEYTNGINRNPGGAIPTLMFGLQGQRWHFAYGLPSSAVAVKSGEPPTEANIQRFRNNTSVLLLALDIKSAGDTFALQYSKSNGTIQIAGKSRSLASIPYPVVSVYSANKTSGDDLSVTGTH